MVTLSGTGSPSSGTGNDGDFYIDMAAGKLFGPKARGLWPSGRALHEISSLGARLPEPDNPVNNCLDDDDTSTVYADDDYLHTASTTHGSSSSSSSGAYCGKHRRFSCNCGDDCVRNPQPLKAAPRPSAEVFILPVCDSEQDTTQPRMHRFAEMNRSNGLSTKDYNDALAVNATPYYAARDSTAHGLIDPDGTLYNDPEAREGMKRVETVFEGGVVLVNDIPKYAPPNRNGSKDEYMRQEIAAGKVSRKLVYAQGSDVTKAPVKKRDAVLSDAEWRHVHVKDVNKRDETLDYLQRRDMYQQTAMGPQRNDVQFEAYNERRALNTDNALRKAIDAQQQARGPRLIDRTSGMDPSVYGGGPASGAVAGIQPPSDVQGEMRTGTHDKTMPIGEQPAPQVLPTEFTPAPALAPALRTFEREQSDRSTSATSSHVLYPGEFPQAHLAAQSGIPGFQGSAEQPAAQPDPVRRTEQQQTMEQYWVAHFQSLAYVQPAPVMRDGPERVGPQPHLYTAAAAPAPGSVNPVTGRGTWDALGTKRNDPTAGGSPKLFTGSRQAQATGAVTPRQQPPMQGSVPTRDKYEGVRGTVAPSWGAIEPQPVTYRPAPKRSVVKGFLNDLRSLLLDAQPTTESTRGAGYQNQTRLFQGV